MRLQGIAARSATMLAEELFSRDLRNRRQVGALSGLVSAPHRSGTLQHDQGLAGSGLPAVRRIAVEVAWAWVRFQPQSRTRCGTTITPPPRTSGLGERSAPAACAKIETLDSRAAHRSLRATAQRETR